LVGAELSPEARLAFYLSREAEKKLRERYGKRFFIRLIVLDRFVKSLT
jgi:hypothetical protein